MHVSNSASKLFSTLDSSDKKGHRKAVQDSPPIFYESDGIKYQCYRSWFLVNEKMRKHFMEIYEWNNRQDERKMFCCH